MEKMLKALFVYPVKSLGGISLKESHLGIKGLQYDRRWMLVNERGDFYSQRDFPQLALLHSSFTTNTLEIEDTTKRLPDLSIPLEMEGLSQTMPVVVWGDKASALLVGTEFNKWFSAYLGKPCFLVYMPESGRRLAGKEVIKDLSFADGYPFLLIGTASLNFLNQKLNQKVGMNRFRPNLVVETTEPFEEEKWNSFSINGVKFEMVKPCARCVMVNVDPKTAVSNKEVLKTLSTFKKQDNKVYFGMNVKLGEQIKTELQISLKDRLTVDA